MDVFLNVYDLTPYNYYTYFLGLGAYHSGIEAGGKSHTGVEYSFGRNETDGTGVYETFPKSEVAAIFRESIFLGKSHLSLAEQTRVLDELRLQFVGKSYHILQRNCNHFTNELSLRLVGKGIPKYVNRGAGCISLCRCLLPAPFANASDESHQSRRQPRFGGAGQVLGGEENYLPESAEDRRKLLASAMDRRLNS